MACDKLDRLYLCTVLCRTCGRGTGTFRYIRTSIVLLATRVAQIHVTRRVHYIQYSIEINTGLKNEANRGEQSIEEPAYCDNADRARRWQMVMV